MTGVTQEVTGQDTEEATEPGSEPATNLGKGADREAAAAKGSEKLEEAEATEVTGKEKEEGKEANETLDERTLESPSVTEGDGTGTPNKEYTEGIIEPPSQDKHGAGDLGSNTRKRYERTESAIESPEGNKE